MDLDALYREHSERLLRYLLRLSGNIEVAEDLLQETFMKALERPPQTNDHPRAWLFTVATNLMRDHARRRGRRDQLLLERHPRPYPGPTPLESAERAELRERLYVALGSLNERERIATVMREEGFTHREIAEAIGTTTGTIGTLLARALQKLSKQLPFDGEAT